MNRTFVFLFFVLTSLSLFAQKEANVWHFGYGNILNFNSRQAVQESGSVISTIECSTSYCDSAVNLLFYSNSGRRSPSPKHISIHSSSIHLTLP